MENEERVFRAEYERGRRASVGLRLKRRATPRVSSQPAVKLRRGQRDLDVLELARQFRVPQAHPEHFRARADHDADRASPASASNGFDSIRRLPQIAFCQRSRHGSQIVEHGVPPRVLCRLPIDHAVDVIDRIRLAHRYRDQPSLIVAFVCYGHRNDRTAESRRMSVDPLAIALPS
jgi:hypothetical protein